MVPKSNQGTCSHIVTQTASSPPSRLHIFSVSRCRDASIATEVSLNFHNLLLENEYFKRFYFTDKVYILGFILPYPLTITAVTGLYKLGIVVVMNLGKLRQDL